MTEIELKFQVAKARRQALARAVATAAAVRVRLRATYYDTPERALAAAGLALRVRREGRRWVQTIKGAGDGLWQRLEHEVVVPGTGASAPAVDAARHDGTPAGEALRRALGNAPLQSTYGTDVMRTRRLVRGPGCLAEIAFDEGALRAGDARWPLCELEFELKSGDAQALAALAARWVQRFGLTLDTRTKAERGERLARGVRVGAAVKAQPLVLAAGVDAAAALRAMVGNSLQQVLANASDVAHEADTPPEQLHQLRVGLRRLRTVLRELGEGMPGLHGEWADALAHVFSRLGSARDRDALAATLLPALHKAGASGLELPNIDPEPAAQLALCEPATTRLWLELLGFAAGSSDSGEPLTALAERQLSGLFRQVRKDADRFGELDDIARHRLRKRVKRLRYLGEFSASQFDAARVRAFQKKLAPAQEALGAFNDVCVARALFKPEAPEQPLAMFALGWLAHEYDDAIAHCVRTLQPLRKVRPFW